MISVPWGIYLPGGLAVQVDKRAASLYQFEFCDPNGCHAPIPLDRRVLREFKRGLKALMQFRDRAQKPVTIEISLIGFTKGWEGL